MEANRNWRVCRESAAWGRKPDPERIDPLCIVELLEDDPPIAVLVDDPDDWEAACLMAGAPDLRKELKRALAALEEAGNHFDHDNPAAAQRVLAAYFERHAGGARAALLNADGTRPSQTKTEASDA